MQYNFHIYNKYQWIEVKLVFSYKYVAGHIQKVGPETRDFWWDLRLKARDPSKGGSRNPRPGIPKVGFKTWDSTDRWDPKPEIYHIVKIYGLHIFLF